MYLRKPSTKGSEELSAALAAVARAGEAPSTGLTEALRALGFETDRLKTGTPPRVDRRTIDFDGLEPQPGDPDVRWFSYDPEVCVADHALHASRRTSNQTPRFDRISVCAR